MSESASLQCWICRCQIGVDRAHATICIQCERAVVRPHAEVWQRLSQYLHGSWAAIVRRGQFDLTQVFGNASAAGAMSVHLHFVQVLGSEIVKQRVNINLDSFAAALLDARPQFEISLLVASSHHVGGSLWSYDAGVSVLREGLAVISALWMQLEHPVAIKICYMRQGAGLKPPPGGHPWHPTKQKKIVKISPYQGDVEPMVGRRDLRI